MARPQAHLTKIDPNRPLGRGVIWNAIRQLREFDIAQLEIATHIPQATLRSYVQALERGGYVAKSGTRRPTRLIAGVTAGGYAIQSWSLVRDVGAQAPYLRKDGTDAQQGRGREQMWRAMKILKDFDYRDLAINASTDEVTVHALDAQSYVKFLARAGYLVQVTKSKPGNKPGAGTRARYRLLPSRNTGPLPPMVQRVKRVYDPNTGQIMTQDIEA